MFVVLKMLTPNSGCVRRLPRLRLISRVPRLQALSLERRVYQAVDHHSSALQTCGSMLDTRLSYINKLADSGHSPAAVFLCNLQTDPALNEEWNTEDVPYCVPRYL